MSRAAWAATGAALLAIACSGDVSGPKALTAPTGVTVTLVSLTSVRIDWTANPADEQVRSYNVLRNGLKVGESTVPSFVDYGLEELQTYRYTVSANGAGSAVSSPSQLTPQSTFTLLDLTGPRVVSSVPSAGVTGVSIASPVALTFSEPLAPATVNAASVSVRVTATDQPVSGAVAYTAGSTTVTFTPAAPLASSTGFTLRVTTAVKDPSSNALLQPYSATFTTAAPVDDTPPAVVGIVPVNGAADVSQGTVVSATFSEDMDPQSVNGTSFTLRPASGGAPVAATVTYNAGSRGATLTPSARLADLTAYTVTIGTAAKDLAGNAIASAFTSGFTTAPPVDNNPPTVSAVLPADAATSVAIATTVRVTFSEVMSAPTITGTTLTLTRTSDGAPVPSTVTFDAGNNRATLAPLAALANGTGYTVTVTTGVRDLVGNALAATFTSRFTTIPADVTPPVVVATQPANNALNVDPSGTISATFNENMDAATMNASTFTLKQTGFGSPATGTVSYNAATRTISLLPDFRLAGSTSYTATISTGARDVSGNALAASVNVVFTTAVVADNDPPRVIITSPLNNAIDTEIFLTISVSFDEPMDAATINGNTFTLRVAGSGTAVPGTVLYAPESKSAQFVPAAPLAYQTAYTINLTPGVRDVSGNSLAAFVSQFTTKAPPPAIIAVSPPNRSGNAAAAAPVTVTFSEAMNPATITAANFYVRNRNTSFLVDGTISYNAASRTATFTPAAPYVNANGYAVTVTTSVTDAAGRPLGARFESCFTPGPGTGAAAAMTGFWAGDSACSDIHWHMRLVQNGTTLSLATPAIAPAPLSNCANTVGECQASALNSEGLIALGGTGVVPITAVTGTVTGTNVSFTITIANGLTYTFTGAFASAPGSPNAWLIGTISGATLPAVGISFENQRP